MIGSRWRRYPQGTLITVWKRAGLCVFRTVVGTMKYETVRQIGQSLVWSAAVACGGRTKEVN